MATIALPWSLSLYVFLLLLATPWASAAVKNCSHLECFYNSRANVSCMWSHEEALNVTTCHVHAKSNLRHWNKTCELTLVRQASWACNLILGSFPESQSLTSVDLLDINVVCWEEKGWRRVKTCDFHPFDNLRLVAPHSLQVLHIDTQRCNISWKVSQVSDFIEPYLEFEARRRLLGHSWEDASVLSLKQRQQWLFLEMLIPSTSYEVQVRVKAQRNNTGTWSPWSQPLTFRTRPASDLDPLILTLSLILVLISLLLTVLALLSHRRTLQQKIWPGIPSPESEFEGLFTTHKGNFQLWLLQRDGCLWWSPGSSFPEDPPAHLEVLSEPRWAVTQAGDPGADDEGPLLEPVGSEHAQDTYLVLDKWLLPRTPCSENLSGPGGSVDPVTMDEASETSSCPSDLASKPRPEGTSPSSFEYTILDPSSQLLCPRALPPELPPTPPHLKYLYLVVSDSGISTDYSSGGSQGVHGDSSDGPYSHPYENSLVPDSEPLHPGYVACS